MPFGFSIIALIGLFFLASFVALMVLFAWVHRTGKILSLEARQIGEHQAQNDFEANHPDEERPRSLPPKMKS